MCGWTARNCDVNLVSDTMGDGIPPSARSRGVSKPEKPTQDTPARAECPVPATKSAHNGAHSAQKCKSFLMADACHTMAKTAPQSVAQYLPPFSHTGQCATAGRLSRSFVHSFGSQLGRFI